jgi:hypothetical protein
LPPASGAGFSFCAIAQAASPTFGNEARNASRLAAVMKLRAPIFRASSRPEFMRR